MKPADPLEKSQGEAVCPKRLWVLTTLSDDELSGDGEALPQGLAFHVSRCEPCRKLADRLLAVTAALREVSQLEPGAKLAERAAGRSAAALRSGAKLTGRVSIPDEPEVRAVRPRLTLWWRLGGVAAAAAIVLGMTLFSVSPRGGPQQPVVTEAGGGSEVAPRPVDVVSEPVDETPTGKRLAGAGAVPETRRGSALRIRRHHSHVEAAFSDDPGGFQAAVVLPDPATRGVGWTGLFDKPARIESTTPLPNDR